MNTATWQQHVKINRIQTILLIVAMAGFMALLGWIIWGVAGIIYLIITSIFLLLLSPAISPQLIMRLYNAQRLSSTQVPNLYSALQELGNRSQLNYIPELYYIPSSMISAFAVGSPNQAGIAITDGFLRSFDLREAISVLAHEISHIRSNDMNVMALADMFSRLTSMLSIFGLLLFVLNLPLLFLGFISINWLVIILLILAPTISTLAQLGLSRIREYDADLNAAHLTGDPEGLASALVKMENIQGGWFERLFLSGRRIPEPSFLRTHPSTVERVHRLLSYKQYTDDNINLDSSTPASLENNLLLNRINRRPGWHFNGLWH